MDSHEMGITLRVEDKIQRIPPADRSSSSSEPPPLGQLPPARPNRAGDGAVDVYRMRELVGFPVRSVKRHKTMSTLVFLCTLGTALLAALVLPRSYHVETRMLAQRNAVMLALGNPRRAVPNDADAPTRLAAEAVRNRDNLVHLINQTQLLENWDRIRSPIGRVKEEWMARLLNRPPVTREERIDQLVEVLMNSLWVAAGAEGSDGTVTISLEWFEPNSAVRIVEQARENFLEQRRAEEIARIAESIAILERHVDSSQTIIRQAMSGASAAAQPAAIGFARGGATDAVSTPTSREREQVALALEAKQTVIADLETARARRTADLQSQLNVYRQRYGPAHPEVLSVQEQLAGLTVDSPQLAALHSEEATLQMRLRDLGGAPRIVSERPDYSSVVGLPSSGLTAGRMYAESRLRMAIADYEDMTDRLKSANIEMETARAAFKYRYTVQAAAKFPKEPSKPNVKLLAIGGLVAAIVFAFFAAIASDLASGKLLEPWQLELLVGTPVIGRLRKQ